MVTEGSREVVDQAQKIGVGLVVGPVRDQAHGAKGHAMVAADLGHGGPFHFDCEGIWQFGAQGLAFSRPADKSVTADDQTMVNPTLAEVQAVPALRPIGLHAGLGVTGRLKEALAPAGVGRKAADVVQRDDMAGKQGRCVHVVLQKLGADDSIPDPNVLPQTACYAREKHDIDPMALNEQGGSAGSSDLADAREDGHKVMSVPEPRPKFAPAAAVGLAPGLSQNPFEFLGQGPHQADFHAGWRSSRRNIFPTGVLGSSVLNSMTRGCL